MFRVLGSRLAACMVGAVILLAPSAKKCKCSELRLPMLAIKNLKFPPPTLHWAAAGALVLGISGNAHSTLRTIIVNGRFV